jgi:hypothetical protein
MSLARDYPNPNWQNTVLAKRRQRTLDGRSLSWPVPVNRSAIIARRSAPRKNGGGIAVCLERIRQGSAA